MAQRNTISFTTTDDEGEELVISFPAKKIVCPRCEGEGRICNPSIGAITQDKWANDWSDEEKEMYLTGGYDVMCPECDGIRVVDAIDEDQCDPESLQKWYDHQDDMAALRRENEAELRAEHFFECRLMGIDPWD